MNTIKNYILILTLFLSGISFAQNVEFKRGNFRDNIDGYKEASDAIDKGEEFFEAGLEDIFNVRDPKLKFDKALKQFLIAQKLNPDNGLNNYRVGVCYIHSSTPYKAIEHLEKAYKLAPECDPFLYYYHGNALQLKSDFNAALKSYSKFEENYRKSDNFSKFVSKRKRECEAAKKFKSDPIRCWVDNVSPLNTDADEIAPSITTDGSEIIFSSNRKNGNSPNEVGKYDHDMYISYNNKGTWDAPKPIPGSINSPLNDIVNNLSYDGTKLLMHKENEGQIDIYESVLKGADWGYPEIMPRAICTKKTDDKYASYSHDGYNITFARGNESRSNGTDIMYRNEE